jgi:hypothetical protein
MEQLRTKQIIWITIVAIVILCGFAGLLNLYSTSTIMPRCSEDVVVIGQGDYNDGLWTSYTCGPAVDDYVSSFPTISLCHEDVVLVGQGDFVNGRWTTYLCGPPIDNYISD